MSRAADDDDERERVLGFAVRSLEFLIVSPTVTSRMGRSLVDDAVSRSSNDFLKAVGKSAVESRELLLCSVASRLLQYLDDNDDRRELVCGLAFDLSSQVERYYYQRVNARPPELIDFKSRLQRELHDNWQRWQWAMVHLRNEIALADVLEAYGDRVLFAPPATPGTVWTYFSPAVSELLSVMWETDQQRFEGAVAAAMAFAAKVQDGYPFSRGDEASTSSFQFILDEKRMTSNVACFRDFTIAEMRGLALLMAFILEVSMSMWSPDEAEQLIGDVRYWGRLGAVAELASSRLTASDSEYDSLLGEWGQLLAAWAVGEQDLWEGLPS